MTDRRIRLDLDADQRGQFFLGTARHMQHARVRHQINRHIGDDQHATQQAGSQRGPRERHQ